MNTKHLFHLEWGLPSTYSIYKRLANLGLAVVAAAVGINIWLSSVEQDQQILSAQADQLGNSLVSHSAKLAASLMQDQDINAVQRTLQQLVEDNHVLNATLHNEYGELMYEAGQSLDLVDMFKTQVSNQPMLYVKEVFQDDKLLGYIRLIMDRQAIMHFQTQVQDHRRQQTYALLLLAFAIGVLVTRAFYKVRYRKLVTVPSPASRPIEFK
ncbi:AhpA/YtjB family protein [Bowmanella denitrificans]|uniref:AhpA/YtjB family protein n=1 Tax=Bowmanella denitrificans TaxID=366582 RepID=UPI000C9D0C1F|nr:AhpA/YtjB family protein [Bowmanella denitrificans]